MRKVLWLLLAFVAGMVFYYATAARQGVAPSLPFAGGASLWSGPEVARSAALSADEQNIRLSNRQSELRVCDQARLEAGLR